MDKRAAAMLAGMLIVSGESVVFTNVYSHNIFRNLPDIYDEFDAYILGKMSGRSAYNVDLKYIDSNVVFKKGGMGIKEVISSSSEKGKVTTGTNPFTGGKIYAYSATVLDVLVTNVNKYVEKLT